ncbi:translation initiation factor [Taibaiella lutea]|uniref:Translation initiation factor n=1 Tax=Taibaiella lutea TaxID=2608001 RepID=A0A5M6CSJ6_9BACT|nr:translation initiation factor [Taibaiella lutea]KAA5536932.1 translation initiation factor [Taibaiella lutea]
MNKKTLNSFSALVFSTNPDAVKQEEPEITETPLPKEQRLKVRIEKKHRGGKTVTIIDGFEGKDEDFQELAKKLKTKCGTGGSAKDGEIIIQGENREKIITWLKEWGYTHTKG